MPGMSTGLSANNPTIVSAFYDELLRQGLIVAVILMFVGVAWSISRSAQLRGAAAAAAAARATGTVAAPAARALSVSPPEAPARRLLRVSFGLLWIFDGILQGQASMPLGMAPQVIQPAAASSPGWVQHLDNAMATIWSYHPVTAPAAAVWIQVGLGVWLLAAPRGTWSRLGGLAGVGWGLIVWIFGEAFGQIFSPGLTLAVRRSGRSPALLRGRVARGPSGGLLEHAPVGPVGAQGAGPVLGGHGRTAGLAGAWVLAGPARRPIRRPGP